MFACDVLDAFFTPACFVHDITLTMVVNDMCWCSVMEKKKKSGSFAAHTLTKKKGEKHPKKQI